MEELLKRIAEDMNAELWVFSLYVKHFGSGFLN